METLREIGHWLGQAADVSLFELSGTRVTVGTLATSLFILLGTIWVSRLVQRGIRRAFARRGIQAESTIGTICTILNYLILVVGVSVALETAGIKLANLFAAGALFAVGLGFAMQNIVQSFVSGVILASERSIRPGDILEVEGQVVQVKKIGIRSTVVQTGTLCDIIMPNSILVQGSVKNFTLRENHVRIDVTVGVHYDSDLREVRRVLEACADGIEWRLPSEAPLVILEDFGSSSIDWTVSVWIEDAWAQRVHRSLLREAIWATLKEAGIAIAYPQLDLHLDPEVTQRLGAA